MKKILVVPLLSIGLSVPAMTLGSPIEPGFDLLTTMPGTEVKIPIPLPGSGEISVPLKGNPSLLPTVLSSRGIDTVVKRKQGIDPFEPPTGKGTIDLELIVLSLKSKDSFDGTPLGYPGMLDLYVTINKASELPISFPNLPQPCTLSDSTGSVTVKHITTDGGTFDANLTVDECLIFVTAGGSVNNPSDIVTSMSGSSISPDPADRELISWDDVPWSHTEPSPPWPSIPSDFPTGGFYPIPPEENVVASVSGPNSHNNRNKWIFGMIGGQKSHYVRLEATDVTLTVSKNGKRVKLKLTTSSEPNAAEFLILRGDKLDNGGTAMNIACSFASKGVASSYTCTDDVVGDNYRVLEKEYDGRVILYDEVITP